MEKVKKDTRYFIYASIVITLFLFLLIVYFDTRNFFLPLILIYSGVELMFLGYSWGIKNKYIPGNWRGSDSMLTTNGIQGKSAEVLGRVIVLIGLGFFVFGVLKLVSIFV